MKKATAILLAAVLILSCIACSVSTVTAEQFRNMKNDKNYAEEIIGTWKMKRVGGDLGCVGACVYKCAEESETYEFKRDGTCVSTTVKASGETEVETYPYWFTDDGMEMLEDGYSCEVKISHGTMYIYCAELIESADIILVLTKQGPGTTPPPSVPPEPPKPPLPVSPEPPGIVDPPGGDSCVGTVLVTIFGSCAGTDTDTGDPTDGPEKPKPTDGHEEPKPTDGHEEPKPTDGHEEPKPTDRHEKPQPTDGHEEQQSTGTRTGGCADSCCSAGSGSGSGSGSGQTQRRWVPWVVIVIAVVIVLIAVIIGAIVRADKKRWSNRNR